MDPYRRRTVDVSEERFDSLEAKMIGIEEALARTSSCAEINRVRPKRVPDDETNLRKELNKKDKMIERLKEKSENYSESGVIGSEIALRVFWAIKYPVLIR